MCPLTNKETEAQNGKGCTSDKLGLECKFSGSQFGALATTSHCRYEGVGSDAGLAAPGPRQAASSPLKCKPLKLQSLLEGVASFQSEELKGVW